REMVAVHPYVPLAGTVRVGIAMLSYRGTLSIGVTGDGDAARDIDVVTAGIERALRELLDAAAATMA
ncbi:MAG TPA: WS/DGAT domain-containing protein, partial [Acidimicrobiia bacterium]|nr:WS/DGAT domain-containing protein [Acidimicrobiia bacterium]